MGAAPVESTMAIFSTARRRGRWRASGETKAFALFGTCLLDLSGAQIDGDELVVRATALFATVKIVASPNLDVQLTGPAIFGAVADRRSASPGEGPTVTVDAFALFGNVVVLDAGAEADDGRTTIDAVADAVAQERPPLKGAAAPDGTTTVLFSDIEGFSALNDHLGDRKAFEVLRSHNDVVRREIAAHGGYEVKSQGDGFMVAFGSARRALECAIAIQRGLAGQQADGEPVRVRIGIHTGEAIKDADDFFGRNVILAARIADQAQGGEILVSSLVKELTDSGGDIRFENGREVTLKGLSGTGKVYSIAWDA